MFNQLNRAKRITNALLLLGITPYDFSERELEVGEKDIPLLTFFLTIDNNLKLNQIMADIKDLIQKGKVENDLILQLVQGWQQTKQKLDTFIATASGGLVTSDQLQELSSEMDQGIKSAQDALASLITPVADQGNSGSTSGTSDGSGNQQNAGQATGSAGTGTSDVQSRSTPAASTEPVASNGTEPPTTTEASNQ